MPKGFGKGRSPTKFSFTYEDYASLVGCSPEAVRKHAQRGNFDPSDLLSVLEFVRDRLQGDSLTEEQSVSQTEDRNHCICRTGPRKINILRRKDNAENQETLDHDERAGEHRQR